MLLDLGLCRAARAERMKLAEAPLAAGHAGHRGCNIQNSRTVMWRQGKRERERAAAQREEEAVVKAALERRAAEQQRAARETQRLQVGSIISAIRSRCFILSVSCSISLSSTATLNSLCKKFSTYVGHCWSSSVTHLRHVWDEHAAAGAPPVTDLRHTWDMLGMTRTMHRKWIYILKQASNACGTLLKRLHSPMRATGGKFGTPPKTAANC